MVIYLRVHVYVNLDPSLTQSYEGVITSTLSLLLRRFLSQKGHYRIEACYHRLYHNSILIDAIFILPAAPEDDPQWLSLAPFSRRHLDPIVGAGH